MTEPKKKDPIADFKSAILAKAADALVAELSPEKMREMVEKVLAEALSEISSSPYQGLGMIVRTRLEEATKAYFTTPEAKELLKSAVEKGVNEAMGSLSAEVRGKVIDLAIAGMVKNLSNAGRIY